MIQIFRSQNNGRPQFLFLDGKDQVIDIPSRFGAYLNASLLISPNSIDKYGQNLRLFLLFALNKRAGNSETVDHLCTSATSNTVQEYLLHMNKKGNKGSTVHTHDRCLRTFFSWLYSFQSYMGLDEKDSPYKGKALKTPKPYRTSVKFITVNELIHFMANSFKTERMRAFIHFMYETGCRVSEACRVIRHDLPDPSLYPQEMLYFPIIIHGSKKKGGIIKDRYSLISRVALSRVYRYFNNQVKPSLARHDIDGSHVFQNAKGFGMKHKSVSDLFYQRSKVLRSQGIIERNYTPHMLRHGAAFSILSSDLGKDLIDKLLLVKMTFGHSAIRSTEVYTNIPVDAMRKIKVLSNDEAVLSRYDEAELIFEKTFLKVLK